MSREQHIEQGHVLTLSRKLRASWVAFGIATIATLALVAVVSDLIRGFDLTVGGAITMLGLVTVAIVATLMWRDTRQAAFEDYSNTPYC